MTINGIRFYSQPTSCGTCPAFSCGASELSPGVTRGLCVIFDDTHHRWVMPRRCAKLFKKAFTYPEDSELIITHKN
jgi:hypothetical protein